MKWCTQERHVCYLFCCSAGSQNYTFSHLQSRKDVWDTLHDPEVLRWAKHRLRLNIYQHTRALIRHVWNTSIYEENSVQKAMYGPACTSTVCSNVCAHFRVAYIQGLDCFLSALRPLVKWTNTTKSGELLLLYINIMNHWWILVDSVANPLLMYDFMWQFPSQQTSPVMMYVYRPSILRPLWWDLSSHK